MVNFPVITDFSIKEYGLYPGKDGQGLNHAFKPGVTVIAGVNGLGKTTLLNALFRVLVGPTDWRSNNTEKSIGNIKHKLTSWKNRKYFAERVLDEAGSSSISATIKFNDDVVEITRRLKDLSIVEFSLNGIPQSNNHDHYQNIVCELSRVGSFFDFYFLLKYLVFFLEDRNSSIWDKKAMDGILRILFYPRVESTEFAELRDNIQEVDSERRNVRAYARRLNVKLAQTLKKTGLGTSIGIELGSVETEITALQERKEELEVSISEAELHREVARQKYARAKLSLEAKQREHQKLQQNYFSNLFPTIENIANYVLVGLDSGGGCLICGSREIGLAERIHNRIQKGECPLCETPSEYHENVIPTQKVEDTRLDKVALEVEHEREELKKLNLEISDLSSHYGALLKEQLETNQKLHSAREKEYSLKSQMPASSEEVNRLKRQVEDNEQYLRDRLSEQRLLEDKLKIMLEKGSTEIKAISNEIETNFGNYIQSFLAEKCELRFQSMEDSVANEAEKISFPRFSVRMTSNTSRQNPQPRSDKIYCENYAPLKGKL